MQFVWDPAKNSWLEQYRGITFENVAEVMFNNEELDVLESPTRPNQFLLVFSWKSYTWAAPYLFDGDGRVVLKTAYPSRKLHKTYGSTGGVR